MQTVSSLIDQYLTYLTEQKGASCYTYKDYKYYLENFSSYLKSSDPVILTNPKKILSYRRSLQGFKASTKNYFLIALRSFFTYLNEIGINTVNPSEIILSNHPEVLNTTLSDFDLERLINQPDSSSLEGQRDRSIIEIFIFTGLKVSKLSLLNRQDADSLGLPENASIHIREYLNMRKDSFKPLFIRLKGALLVENDGEGMRISPRSIERMIEKYRRELNIKATPQILRHSYASGLMARGETIKELQKRMGYRSAQSPRRYSLIEKT